MKLWGTWGTFPALITRRSRGACWSSGMGLGRVTSFSTYSNLHQSNHQLVKSLFGAPLVLGQPRATLDSQDSPRPGLRGSHHLPPYIILCSSPRGPHPNGFLSQDSQVGVPKFQQLGFPQLWGRITSFANLRLQWGLNQSYNPRWELFNGVSHST
jgi:hypothetical protein